MHVSSITRTVPTCCMRVHVPARHAALTHSLLCSISPNALFLVLSFGNAVSYFIPEDGDMESRPNVFLAPKPRQQGYPPSLGQVKTSFPLPGRYHFRFKAPLVPGTDRDKGAMPVWMDCVDDRQPVPVWKSQIVAKVTRIGIEDEFDDDDHDFDRPAGAAAGTATATSSAVPPPKPPQQQQQQRASPPSVDLFGDSTPPSAASNNNHNNNYHAPKPPAPQAQQQADLLGGMGGGGGGGGHHNHQPQPQSQHNHTNGSAPNSNNNNHNAFNNAGDLLGMGMSTQSPPVSGNSFGSGYQQQQQHQPHPPPQQQQQHHHHQGGPFF